MNVDFVCPVCRRTFQVSDQYVRTVRKHAAGPLYCSRPCIEIAELAAEALRLSALPGHEERPVRERIDQTAELAGGVVVTRDVAVGHIRPCRYPHEQSRVPGESRSLQAVV